MDLKSYTITNHCENITSTDAENANKRANACLLSTIENSDEGEPLLFQLSETTQEENEAKRKKNQTKKEKTREKNSE